MQSIRRSFTAPTKPPPSPVQSPRCADPLDSAAEVLFSHPAVRIVSFSPPKSTTHSSAPARLRSASTPLSIDLDYPMDGEETYPWHSTTEKTVASGLLIIEKVRGSTCFLKCGQILQALMRNSQCWCVDGVSKFVLRVRELQYYRIELPSETEEDKSKVEALKVAWKKIIRYEVTPCPFKRGFKVDLPVEARTPKKKKAWTPRKSIASVLPDDENRPQTAPEQNGEGINAPNKKAWAANGKVFQDDSSADVSNEDTVDDSASTSESDFSIESQDTFSEPRTPTPPKNLPKVRPVVYALEQELAKATEAARRQSLPVRLEAVLQDKENIQTGTLTDISSSDQEEEKEATKQPSSEGGIVEEEEPLTAVENTTPPPDLLTSELVTQELETAPDTGIELAPERGQSSSQRELSLERVASSPIKEPILSPLSDKSSACQASIEESDSTDSDLLDREVPGSPSVSDDNDSNSDDFKELPQLSADKDADSMNPAKAIYIPAAQTASSEDSESLASSSISFHTAASEEFEEDTLTPPPDAKYSPFVKSVDLSPEILPPSHKHEKSDLTVTTLIPLNPPEEDTTETPSQSLQQSSPSYIPATISSPMSDWPIIDSSSATGPAKVGLRQRSLRPRRSFSPLPHPSTLLNSPQTQSAGHRIATVIMQKASSIALGKPIEMAAMLFHVIGRIVNGATVADLLSGDLFYRPAQEETVDDAGNSTDEDDFGLPIRGRKTSRTPSNISRRTNETRTPSELD